MSITLLNKTKTQLRVREASLPLATSPILGNGIDATTLPEGHLSCVRCKGYKFEAWVYMDAHRLEMGCVQCNENYRLLFPMDVTLPMDGRFICKKHPEKAMVLIHNVDVVCVGCESCRSEIQIFLKTKSNLVMA
jgi:hypothetical protein